MVRDARGVYHRAALCADPLALLTMRANICAWLAAAIAASIGVAATHADDHGRALFEECRACHTLERGAPAMAGPNLNGLIGRPVAGDSDFDYSPALRQARSEGTVWTPDLLDRFLVDPEAVFPGLWMTFRGLKEANDRAALIGFLRDPQSR